MRTLIFVFSLTLLLSLDCTGKKKVLFNGKNLKGWTVFVSDSTVNPAGFFYVKDGVIETPGVPNGYLRTTGEFSNYKLHVEWRYPEKPTNSGIFLHTRGSDKMWPIHYQCQLKHLNAGDFIIQDVGLRATVRDSVYVSTAAVKPIATKMEAPSEKQPGEWNAADITCNGDNITIIINGALQNQASKCSIASGGIGLQAEGSKIQFRNIWIERLQ